MLEKKRMSKLLLDTNIQLYAIDNHSSRQVRSQDILNSQEYALFTSSKNISEFFCAATRGDQAVISISDALHVVRHYRSILEVLYADHNSSVKWQ